MPVQAQTTYQDASLTAGLFNAPIEANSTQLVSSRIPPEIERACSIATTTDRSIYVNGYVIVPSNGTDIRVYSTATNTVLASTASTSTTSGIYYNTVGNSTILVPTTASTAAITQGSIAINGTNYFIYNTGVQASVRGFQIAKKVALARERKTKSSIKRALKLMLNVGFEEEARIFLKGDTVEVAHPESLFKFVIKKAHHSIMGRTERPGYSTPYVLELHTKSDVHVANLCVYMENTPMLDQVLAVAMFIKSGSEEMILKQANWFRLNDDRELREILALEYPYLRRKLQQ